MTTNCNCIISVPNPNPNSLRFQISVDEGVNKLLKHRATLTGYYPTAVGLSVQEININPMGIYSPNVNVASLLIQTDGPVQITVTKNNVAQTFVVNQLYLTDCGYDNFTLINPSSTATLDVVVAFTQ